MKKIPKKNGDYIKNIFDRAVDKYDFMNTIMTFGLDRYWRRLLVNCSKIKAGDSVLDICCGTGMLSMELAKFVKQEGSITGIDFSSKMLKIAEKKIYNNNLHNIVNLIQTNTLNLPFENNTFDCAVTAWGLRNVSNINLAVQEMIRVIKPGSKVLSLDMAHPVIPIFKNIYWFCFKNIIPEVGRIFSSCEEAYCYLYESSREFIKQEQLAKIFENNGLEKVNYYNLCGGIAAIVEGYKSIPGL